MKYRKPSSLFVANSIAAFLLITGVLKLFSYYRGQYAGPDPVLLNYSLASVHLYAAIVEIALAGWIFISSHPTVWTWAAIGILSQAFIVYHLQLPPDYTGCGCLGDASILSIEWRQRISNFMFASCFVMLFAGMTGCILEIARMTNKRSNTTTLEVKRSM